MGCIFSELLQEMERRGVPRRQTHSRLLHQPVKIHSVCCCAVSQPSFLIFAL